MNNEKYLKYIRSQDLYNFKDKKNNIFNHTIYMLMRTDSIFKWSGLPDTIPEKYLENYLQIAGFACIGVGDDEGSLYAFYGGLGGEPDVYYNPTICTVANPYLNLSKNFKIDEDCVIIRNDKFYMGLIPLFNRYASMLVENELSMNMASINTRIQQAISAGDDRAKESAETFLKNLVEGDIAVLADNAFLDSDTIKTLPFSNTSSSGVLGDLIEYEQYLKASWYNEIGLNANYNMKREALNSAESSINDDILFPLIDEMLKMRKEGADKVNEMFGTDISVDLSSSWRDNKKEESIIIDNSERSDVNESEESEKSISEEREDSDENSESEESEKSISEEREDSDENSESENNEPAESAEITEDIEDIKEDIKEIEQEVKGNE